MKLLQKYKAYILGVYAFFIGIHFVFKDHYFPLSILFYAAPLILILLLGYFSTLLYWQRKSIFILLFLLQATLTFHWVNCYYLSQTKKTLTENTKAVLFWNVAKNQALPIDIISNKAKQYHTDIISLVEASHIKQREIETLKKNLKDFHFKKLKGDMLIGINGELNSIHYKYEEHSYKFNHIEATINTTKTSLLIVDIYASPFINKAPALQAIFKYAKTHNIDIIVGDFNTPYESIYFNNYKSLYTSFHDYGNGFTATWPHNFPLLELDQVWINTRFTPYKLKTSIHPSSDHKLLIAEYYKN